MKQNNKLSMELFNKKTLGTVGKKLLRKKQTVAVAESDTSGLLQLAFSSIQDAVKFFRVVLQFITWDRNIDILK